MSVIKKNFAHIIYLLLMSLAVFTANSACVIINHQEEEPDSIKLLRKHI